MSALPASGAAAPGSAGPEAAAPEGRPAGRPLDELVMAMDVVDTLRHQRRLVERELDSEAREEDMIRRLREIYAAQGIEVPEHVLADGVAALREQRFVYRPPEGGFGHWLAGLYVSRARWGRPLLLGLVLLVALWIGYYFLFERPRELAREQTAIELSETLPNDINSLLSEIEAVSQEEAATERASALAAGGLAAARVGEIGPARQALADLGTLLDTLNQAYDLRIVSRPGEPSGVWRIPEANPVASNYYLIVEAIDERGERVPVTIVSEEDQTRSQVETWGLRVDESVFNAVRADKQDDGIIQNGLVGTKQRGQLAPRYSIPTSGAAIAEW